MNDSQTTELATRALEVARRAWSEAHRGLPANPMTRTADPVATATIAASLLGHMHLGEQEAERRAVRAIRLCRAVCERTRDEAPGNPIMRTSQKASVGILAAGLLNYEQVAFATPEV